MKPKKKIIFVISGPSGSGKTTLVNRVLADGALKKKLIRSVSYTTRPRRSGEKDSRDYVFISDKKFREQIRSKKFIEWIKYLGYYYGTSRRILEGQLNKSDGVLLCLDVRGALKIKRLYPQSARLIFVKPPSLMQLPARIKNRCNKIKEKEVRQRLRLAAREVRAAGKYDYSIVNSELSAALKALRNILLTEIGK